MGKTTTVVIKSLFCGGNPVVNDDNNGGPILQIDKVSNLNNNNENSNDNLGKDFIEEFSITDDDMTRSYCSNDQEKFKQQKAEEKGKQEQQGSPKHEKGEQEEKEEHQKQYHLQQQCRHEQQQQKQEQGQTIALEKNDESTVSTFKSFDIEITTPSDDDNTTYDGVSALGMHCAFDAHYMKGRGRKKSHHHHDPCSEHHHHPCRGYQSRFCSQKYHNLQLDRAISFHSLRRNNDKLDLGILLEEEESSREVGRSSNTKNKMDDTITENDTFAEEIGRLLLARQQSQHRSFGSFDYHPSVVTGTDQSNKVIPIIDPLGDKIQKRGTYGNERPLEKKDNTFTRPSNPQSKEPNNQTDSGPSQSEHDVQQFVVVVAASDGDDKLVEWRSNNTIPKIVQEETTAAILHDEMKKIITGSNNNDNILDNNNQSHPCRKNDNNSHCCDNLNTIRVDRIYSSKTQQRYRNVQEKIHEERSYWISTVSALVSTYGTNHIKTAEGLMQLGDTYINTKDYSKSIVMFQSAIHIWEYLTNSSSSSSRSSRSNVKSNNNVKQDNGGGEEKNTQQRKRRFQVAMSRAMDRIGFAYLLQLSNCYNDTNNYHSKTDSCSSMRQSSSSYDGSSMFHTAYHQKVLLAAILPQQQHQQQQHQNHDSSRFCNSSSTLLWKTMTRIGSWAWGKMTETSLHKEKSQYVTNALQFLSESFRIRYQEFGPFHVDTVDTYNKIAACYLQMNDYQKALDAYLEIHCVRDAIFGPHHPSVAVSAQALGTIYSTMGEGQEEQGLACTFFECALEIYQTQMNLPNDHPIVVGIQQDLKAISQ